MKEKICLISSTGGHLQQLLQLKKLNSEFDIFWVTEENEVTRQMEFPNKVYYLKQQDRRKKNFIIMFILNLLKSIRILAQEKPKTIITTGSGVVIPICVLAKISGKQVIFIESFAKINSPTITGKVLYKLKIADRIYVQSEKLLDYYEKAIYKGSLY